MPKKVVKKRVMKGGSKYQTLPQPTNGKTQQEPQESKPSVMNSIISYGSSLLTGMKTVRNKASNSLGSAYKTSRNAATSLALATNKSTHNLISSKYRGYGVNRNNVNFTSVENLKSNTRLNNSSNKNNVKNSLKAYVSSIGTTLNGSTKVYGEIDALLKEYATQEKTFKYDLDQIEKLVNKIESLTNKRYENSYKKEINTIVLKLKDDFNKMLSTLRKIYNNFTQLIDSIYGDEQSSTELLKQLKNARTYVKELLIEKTTYGTNLFKALKNSNDSYNKIKEKIKNRATFFNSLTKLNNSKGNVSSGSSVSRFTSMIPFSSYLSKKTENSKKNNLKTTNNLIKRTKNNNLMVPQNNNGNMGLTGLYGNQ